MNRPLLVAVCVAAVVAAGCSGGPPQLTAIAKSIHCADLRPVQPSAFASAEGRCVWNGSPAEVATFANDKLRGMWEKMEKALGEKAFYHFGEDGPGWAMLYRGS